MAPEGSGYTSNFGKLQGEGEAGHDHLTPPINRDLWKEPVRHSPISPVPRGKDGGIWKMPSDIPQIIAGFGSLLYFLEALGGYSHGLGIINRNQAKTSGEEILHSVPQPWPGS